MLSIALAFGGMVDAHAQNTRKRTPHTTVLPVLTKESGKVEAVLELQPTGQVNAGARWKFGSNSIDAAFGLSSGDSLGLLCSSSGGGASITTLASHCMLASVGGKTDVAGNDAVCLCFLDHYCDPPVPGAAGWGREASRMNITAAI